MRPVRRNSDERARDLERRARQGDPQAAAALQAVQRRHHGLPGDLVINPVPSGDVNLAGFVALSYRHNVPSPWNPVGAGGVFVEVYALSNPRRRQLVREPGKRPRRIVVAIGASGWHVDGYAELPCPSRTMVYLPKGPYVTVSDPTGRTFPTAAEAIEWTLAAIPELEAAVLRCQTATPHISPPAQNPGPPPPIRWKNVHLDHHSGQDDFVLGAVDPATDVLLGHLRYTLFNDRIYIGLIHTEEDRRRQGVGLAMLRQLESLYPGLPILPGTRTDMGEPLWQAFARPRRFERRRRESVERRLVRKNTGDAELRATWRAAQQGDMAAEARMPALLARAGCPHHWRYHREGPGVVGAGCDVDGCPVTQRIMQLPPEIREAHLLAVMSSGHEWEPDAVYLGRHEPRVVNGVPMQGEWTLSDNYDRQIVPVLVRRDDGTWWHRMYEGDVPLGSSASWIGNVTDPLAAIRWGWGRHRRWAQEHYDLGPGPTPSRKPVRSNGDEQRRRAERDLQRTGDVVDKARVLAVHLRDGTLSPEKLQFLARLGDQAARTVAGSQRETSASPAACIPGHPDALDAQAQEVLNEVGALGRLWPLAAAAALMSAMECVEASAMIVRPEAAAAIGLARGAVEDALAVVQGLRPKLWAGHGMQYFDQYRWIVAQDLHASDLVQAAVGTLMQIAHETRHQVPAHESRPLGDVMSLCVVACTTGRPPPNTALFDVECASARVKIAHAVTEAVVPAVLADDPRASPLLQRPLPWQA